MGKNTRLNTLDIAKGIGIIFVVFAHVNYTPSLLVLIYSFHMPLFFILAGMVFNREKYPTFKDFLKRRWETMIIPYLIFSALSMIYVFVSEKMFEAAVVVLTTIGWILESGLLDFDNTILPWSLDSALFALSFYATGNIFSKPVITAIKNIKKDESKNMCSNHLCYGCDMAANNIDKWKDYFRF